MIKLQVIGHLGKDAIVNTVNGKNVINFSVCHTEKFKDAQGNQKEKSIWVECGYWTDKTGIAPYLLKGTQVYAEGTPEVATYPKNDGSTGVSLKLRVGMVQLLGSANKGDGTTTAQTAPPAAQAKAATTTPGRSGPVQQSPENMTEPIDDLPF